MLAIVFGVLSFLLTAVLTVPPSRALITTLQDLITAAREANPELFGERLSAIDPFASGSFKHNRITPMLRADLSEFGQECLSLQKKARSLDRRAHIGMLPLVAFALGIGIWALLR